MRSQRFSLGVVASVVFLLPAWVLAQQGLSHVRVVRLSFVSGTVGLKKPGATEPSKAMVNTPIQEGFELETSANSYAEVEFENGSSARLGQLTRAEFTQLAMDADGNKLNRLKINQGYATFHFMPERGDVYSVMLANATLNPSGKSEFRTDYDAGQARVEVFSGSVDVSAGGKSARLGKDQVLQFTPGGTEMAFKVQHGITKDDWDKWTEERDQQQQLAFRDQAVSAPRGTAYGWSDLDFYGEWAMIPGFGYGWAPYAAAGWSPFTMGMWDMYPGMGMTWISSEPWGWLPYHYGLWNFDPTFGWFWMPGGLNFFSPALVNWYGGPGWVGWAPQGVAYPRMTTGITTVPGTMLRTEQLLTLADVQRQPITAGSRLKAPPAFEAGAPTTLSGSELASLRTASPSAAVPARTAPATLLMGGDPAAERALLEKQPGALGRAFGVSHPEPLRVRAGTTLGGTYSVRGSAGEFQGDIFRQAERGAKGMNGPANSNRSQGGFSHPMVLAHGRSSMSGSGGSAGAAPSGGTPGSMSGSASASSSISASSSPSSAGHSASSGGGHH